MPKLVRSSFFLIAFFAGVPTITAPALMAGTPRPAAQAAADSIPPPAELIAARPGLMCVSPQALASLTLQDGSSRTAGGHPSWEDLQLKAVGGCLDIPLGAHVAIVSMRRNTSIVRYDAGDGHGSREFVVPNVDFVVSNIDFTGKLESPAVAAPSHDFRLAYSTRLGVQVFADRSDWCGRTIDLRVVGAAASVFALPDFAALLQRLGSAVIAPGCPAAESVRYTGFIENGPPVWQQTATALEGWAPHREAPPSATALDLDRAGPAATVPPATSLPAIPLATLPPPPDQPPPRALPFLPPQPAAPPSAAHVAIAPPEGRPPRAEAAAMQPISECPAIYPGPDDARQLLLCRCSSTALESGTVIGTLLYSFTSVPCRAARHAGVIGPDGGTVAFFPVVGSQNLKSSSQNGIDSGAERSTSAFMTRTATTAIIDLVQRSFERESLRERAIGVRTPDGRLLVPQPTPRPALLDLAAVAPSPDIKIDIPGTNEMSLPLAPLPLVGDVMIKRD